MTACGLDLEGEAAPWAADRWDRLPSAYGEPPGRGLLRARPQDFRVFEELAFEPDGAGEHVLLLVRKVCANTRHVVRQLARLARVAPVDVGYAGLKDRRAIAEQWFSVRLPGGREEPDWDALVRPEWRVLRASRHSRKLRHGALQSNRFSIRVRELAGAAGALEQRLGRIAEGGVPNYFGPQRFGRGDSNLARAWKWLVCGEAPRPAREARGFALSAARSLLFNAVTARRVAAANWDAVVAGDVAGLDGSGSVFAVTAPQAELEARVGQSPTIIAAALDAPFLIHLNLQGCRIHPAGCAGAPVAAENLEPESPGV